MFTGWAGLYITTRLPFQAQYWPLVTMSSTVVIVLNKGTSLVVWKGLDLVLPVRWPSLHRGKLAILSAVTRHTYLKDCLKEDVTVSGKVFSLVCLMAVEHSQYRTASFSAKVTSWWHSCPGSYEHIGNVPTLLHPNNSLVIWLWEHFSCKMKDTCHPESDFRGPL